MNTLRTMLRNVSQHRLKLKTATALAGSMVALLAIILGFAAWQDTGSPSSPDGQVWQGPHQGFAQNGDTILEIFGGSVVASDDSAGGQPYQTQRQSTMATGKQPGWSVAINLTGQKAVKPSPSKAAPKPGSVIIIDDKPYVLRVYEPQALPNDPAANQAWTVHSTVDQAWDIPAGQHQALIAIIDTGFGLQHEEFDGRWHSNTGEQGSTSLEAASRLNCADRNLALAANCNLIDDDGDGLTDEADDGRFGQPAYQNPSRLNCSDQNVALDKSCNQIDDDANGFIDDVTGWDFVNNDNSVQAGELNPTGSGTTHGTRVAGIAAATGNNGKGIAGVDWQARILPIQALDDDAYGDTRGVGRAILYAASQGADIINLSLGSDFPDDYVREAIMAATAAGSVVVAASGNDGCNCMVYPANYLEVVSVGALGTNSQPAGFNSYGTNLDILAPGTQMTTTSWTNTNQTNAYATNVQGTSFAAPLVSGVLSRMKSQRPQASPLQLIAALHENTNRSNQPSLPAHIPRSPTHGYGLADAFQSLNRMITPRAADQLTGFAPVSRGNSLLTGTSFEPTALTAYTAYPCTDGRPGATPLYEIIRSSSRLYSISQTEVWQAQRLGHQTQLFAEVCLQQPHDTATSIRTLNVPPEFRNAPAKQ